jgi:aminoglycoside/choline kinase family phosphotransferase
MSAPETMPHQSPHALADLPPVEYLLNLLKRVVPDTHAVLQVRPLPGDASDRRYYRLEVASKVDGMESLVLMRLAQAYTAGELPFVNVQRYFSLQGIPVPDIFCDDSAHGFVLLEDLGDVTLESAWQEARRDQLDCWYRQALDILLMLQHPEKMTPRANCVAFGLAFDVDKLMWELDFFLTYMLKRLCGVPLKSRDEAVLRGQFWKIAALLARQPRFLAHRDFHSRNLMLHQDRLRVLDFQDARLGPCQYDLASLLYDSYVILPADLREELLTYYLERKAVADGCVPARESFLQVFDYMCLQRNLKALGTFAFQTVEKHNRRYVEAILPTVGYIQENLARHPELRQLTALLEEHLFATVPDALRDEEAHIPGRSPVR